MSGQASRHIAMLFYRIFNTCFSIGIPKCCSCLRLESSMLCAAGRCFKPLPSSDQYALPSFFQHNGKTVNPMFDVCYLGLQSYFCNGFEIEVFIVY